MSGRNNKDLDLDACADDVAHMKACGQTHIPLPVAVVELMIEALRKRAKKKEA